MIAPFHYQKNIGKLLGQKAKTAWTKGSGDAEEFLQQWKREKKGDDPLHFEQGG